MSVHCDQSPFQVFRKQIVIHLVYFVTMVLNATPLAQGISETFLPRVLVTSRVLTLIRCPRLSLGNILRLPQMLTS